MPVAAQRRLLPASVADLRELLAEHDATGQAVRIVGQGQHLDIGAPLARPAVQIGTGSLRRLVDYRPRDWVVTVEAGMPVRELQELLRGEGQFAPLDGWGAEEASVGGLLAAGLLGPLATGYGPARDFTLGLKAVLPPGRLVRTGAPVVKNVAGYDLTKLMVGALGSLGVLVEATLRVQPLPPERAVVGAAFPDAGAAVAAARRILQRPLRPEVVEVTSLGAGVWHVVCQVAGGSAAVRRKVDEVRACLAEGDAVEAEGILAQVRKVPCRASAVLAVVLPARDLAARLEAVRRLFPDGLLAVRALWGAGELSLAEVPEDVDRRIRELRSFAEAWVQRLPASWRARIDPYGRAPTREERHLRAWCDPHRILNPGVALADREGV